LFLEAAPSLNNLYIKVCMDSGFVIPLLPINCSTVSVQELVLVERSDN
jgi:hypothetical protein